MNYDIAKATFGKREQVKMLSPEVLTYLGEDGLRQLISNHYDCLIESEIKDLFPKEEEGLKKAKQHSADFFIQLMGGPQYFNQNRGKPMMAKRHAPFKITPEARIVWLECYIEVLEKLDAPDNIKQSYWDYLNTFSTWMINTPSDNEGPGFAFG